MTLKRPSSFFCMREIEQKYQLKQIQDPDKTQPLSETCCSGRVKVCKVNGNRKLCARMAQLGLLPGCEIELLCPCQGQQCMIKINGGTLSLDIPSAENILVTPV
jgi:Fe2+ transport system protein FeoA